MSAKVALTPAEEARDGIRLLERLLTEQMPGVLAVVRNELKEVHELAAKTANDNDLRWGRAKKAILAMAGLVVLTGVWISFDGGHSVRLALAWLSRMIT
jgi:hypothetical protein